MTLGRRAHRELVLEQARVFTLDGSRFDDLDGFFDEVSRVLVPGARWGRNLDAFNDLLRGGFGTPDGGFVVRWIHADRSAARLGHAATARWLESKVETCHPANVARFRRELADARAGEGPTLFDTLIGILRDHGEGGSEAEDRVVLELVPGRDAAGDGSPPPTG